MPGAQHPGRNALLYRGWQVKQAERVGNVRARTADLLRQLLVRRAEIIKKLLENPKVNLNIKDNHGNTALYWAMYKKELDIINLFLASPNLDPNAQAILPWASENNYKKLVKLFPEKYADFYSSLREGKTSYGDLLC